MSTKRKNFLDWSPSTHCYRRFHQNCLHSHPSHCTRSCAARSGHSRSACSPSYTHGWLRSRQKIMWTPIIDANSTSMAGTDLKQKQQQQQQKSFTHHSRTVSHQTCPCSGPYHHKSGCSWYSHHFHTQTHRWRCTLCCRLWNKHRKLILEGITLRYSAWKNFSVHSSLLKPELSPWF